VQGVQARTRQGNDGGWIDATRLCRSDQRQSERGNSGRAGVIARIFFGRLVAAQVYQRVIRIEAIVTAIIGRYAVTGGIVPLLRVPAVHGVVIVTRCGVNGAMQTIKVADGCERAGREPDRGP
jgi:hypothetical protein